MIVLTLPQLGQKICIIGCSSSGKSTLAQALSRKLHIPAYHLDLLAHQAHSNWQRQSDAYLISEHAKILQQPTWIIEGNYSICMPERLQLASAVIWLDSNVYAAAWRYIMRSLRNDPHRPGRLMGATKEFKFWLLKYIFLSYPSNRLKYQELLINSPGILIITLHSMRELKQYYQFWQLKA